MLICGGECLLDLEVCCLKDFRKKDDDGKKKKDRMNRKSNVQAGEVENEKRTYDSTKGEASNLTLVDSPFNKDANKDSTASSNAINSPFAFLSSSCTFFTSSLT